MTTSQETQLHPLIQTVLSELGEGDSARERQCFELFLDGQYDQVKTYRLEDLENYYYRALSYLASAVTVSRSPNKSNLPTVLSEACEAVANYKRQECLKRLASCLSLEKSSK